jgi:hypothetical protein
MSRYLQPVGKTSRRPAAREIIEKALAKDIFNW